MVWKSGRSSEREGCVERGRVCVWESERESEREIEAERACVCVCTCVKEIGRERMSGVKERNIERLSEREGCIMRGRECVWESEREREREKIGWRCEIKNVIRRLRFDRGAKIGYPWKFTLLIGSRDLHSLMPFRQLMMGVERLKIPKAGMELFSRRRWRLASTLLWCKLRCSHAHEAYNLFCVQNKQQLTAWADASLRLLLLKSSMDWATSPKVK